MWKKKNIAVAQFSLIKFTSFLLIYQYSILSFEGNYTRMLRAISNKSWKQHPIKKQLYGHLLPITKSIQVRRTRHAEHCWRCGDELISDILLWTPSHVQAKAGWPARTYIQQLCADTGCSLEDLPGVMNDREGWQERVREICAGSMIWFVLILT